MALCSAGLLFSWESQAQRLPAATRHVRTEVLTGEAKFLRPMSSAERLHLHVVLPVRDQAGLDKFLEEVGNPSSPSFRHFLTVPQFTERFGPAESDYDALTQFAASNGFAIAGGSRDGMDLHVVGTVATIERALNVTMGVYQDPADNHTFYSADREPTLDLKVKVWHISGLDDHAKPHPMYISRAAYAAANGLSPDAVVTHATTGSGPSASFLGSDMRAAYYGGTALTGAGQNLGLFEYYGTDLADLAAYYSNVNQTNNVPVSLLSTDGSSTACLDTAAGGNCDDTEQTLDITQALGMAPGLASLVVYIGSTDTAIISAMTTHNPLPMTIGCSWGWTPADPAALNPYLQKMAAQGQSFFVASGDNSTWTKSGNAAAWPGDNAYVISVGGTDLTTAGPGGAWLSETAWSGSGGGISPDTIAIPSWQQLSGVINSTNKGSTTLRNGPDVSANANFTFYVCANQSSCTANSFGGTSFAAPMWAGYVALANQQAAASGMSPVGFLNPTIYSQNLTSSTYAADFHDIVSGVSGSNSAVIGYDLVTGWGSPNGVGLINSLVSGSSTSTPANVSVSPAAGIGASQVFTAVFSDSAGAADLDDRSFLINSTLNTSNACYIVALPAGLYLGSQTGASLAGPLTSSGTLSNSQCTLNGNGSSVNNSGNNSTVVVSITFTAAFAGAKNIYMNAGDTYGNHSGWQLEGTYTVAAGTLTSVSVAPNASVGVSQTFTAVFSDSAGAAYLDDRSLLINSTLNTANGCYVVTLPAGIYLGSDSGASLAGPLTASGTLSNSQCTLNGSGSAVSNSGNNSTVTIAIAFTSAFVGAKTIYMNTGDIYSNHSGWQSKGAFTDAAGTLTADSVTPGTGAGVNQVFTAVFSDSAGAFYLNDRNLLINSIQNAAGACYVVALPAGIYLASDSGASLAGPLTASGTLSNSQCILNGSGSAASNSGNSSILTVSIAFTAAFAGSKNIYMNTGDVFGNHSGWQTKGTYTVAAGTLANASLAPGTGSGVSQVFTAVFSDSAGAAYLNDRNLLINSIQNAAGACYVVALPAGIYLASDSAASLTGPLTASGTLSNSQCTLNGSGSSVSNSGTNSTLTISINFTGAFAGAKNVYMNTGDVLGNHSGWQSKGTYAVVAGTLSNTSLAPGAGGGVSQVFTAVFSSSAGASYLNDRNLLINSIQNAAGACYVVALPAGIYLASDSAASLSGPLTASGTLSNSQCTLNGSGSSVSNSGTNSTVTVSIYFAAGFAGAKNIYMNTGDIFGNHTGWQIEGTYTVAAGTLSNTSLTPSTGSGTSQVFTAVFSDSAGTSYLNDRNLLINSIQNAAAACYVVALPAGIYLASDSAASLAGPLTASGTLSNSQCTLNGSGSSVSNSGTNSTVTVSVSFTGAFAGAMNIYMNTGDIFGNHTGWQAKGTYTVAAGTLTADSVAPSTGTGISQVFTAVFSDTAGAAYLNDRNLLINSILNAAGGCYVVALPAGIYLASDSGASLAGPLTGSGTLSNSQCTLNGSGSSVSNAGNSSTLTVLLTFASAFTGAKNIYMNAGDVFGNHTGWQIKGSFTDGGNLMNSSVSPASGSGLDQVFTAVFTDTSGAAYLNDRNFLINSTLNAAGGCYVVALPAGIYLAGDSGSSLAGPLTASGTLSNSQCTLNGSGSSVNNSGNISTVTISIAFNAGFTGAKNIYIDTGDVFGNHSGWQTLGTFTP